MLAGDAGEANPTAANEPALRRYRLRMLGLLLAAVLAEADPLALQQPYDTAYAGDNSTGGHVVACWSFDGADPTVDASGHGHDGRLLGARIVPDGRFGSALRTAPGFPIADERHALVVPAALALSPRGAFTLEMWVAPDEWPDGYGGGILLDKKYVPTDHTDYMLSLDPAGEQRFRLRLELGFATRSAVWHSDAVAMPAGSWHHIAAVVDGGAVRLFIDGELRGRFDDAPSGGIAAGTRPLSIGDRLGSNYRGFPGRIDQVRISDAALEFRPLRIERTGERGVFVRMETDAAVEVGVTNLTGDAIAGGTLTAIIDAQPAATVPVPPIASGQTQSVPVPIDTQLRPDDYEIALQFAAGDAESAAIVPFAIVPRPLPDAYPVVLWGGGFDDIERIDDVGFTHFMGILPNEAMIAARGTVGPAHRDDLVARHREGLDEALRRGLRVTARVSPGRALRAKPELRRIGRDGRPVAGYPDICPRLPGVIETIETVGRSVAQTYGDHPAFDSTLVETEVRDAAFPCFHPVDIAAMRAAGVTPPKVPSKWGADYRRIDGVPDSRIVPRSLPELAFMRWYWRRGDGWNKAFSALHDGLRSGPVAGRSDFWTFHDPAVRVAKIFGSGGRVDTLSQWTYAYPDPFRIGLATEETLAMAAGASHEQSAMAMTQIIWYRSQVAPAGAKTTAKADWEREQAEAKFITIPPHALREAFWSKIARPIDGIMYHGWESLAPASQPSSYRFTNAAAGDELARLIDAVVTPLGPTLRAVPPVRSDVVMLQSFASEMLARRGTFGWSGKWLGDSWHIARWAGLQPEIVYDETIEAGGLDGRRVLILTDCDVLTEQVATAIRRFQVAGGVVIGDDALAPGVTADITLSRYERTGRADVDKAAMQRIAADLKRRLAPRYEPAIASDDPDVLTYRRRVGETDYVFLINDRRTFGGYVGHHGRVMETGLPTTATLTLPRAGAVYDLVASRSLSFESSGTKSLVATSLAPGGGTLLMATPQPIAGVRVDAAETVSLGGSLLASARVVDAGGGPIAAVVPVEVRITDSLGREVEGSGFYAARGGGLTIPIDIAPNDAAGVWTIAVRELASGSTSHATVRVGEAIVPGAVGPNAADPVQPAG